MSKDQNNHVSILDAIETLNSFGLEVVSGIIMGLDSDTPQTAENLLHFIEVSKIPILTINLLQALPRTALYRRLQAEGRLSDDPNRESNVIFKLPYEQVLAMWRRTFSAAYTPEALYARFNHNRLNTWTKRIKIPPQGRATSANIRSALTIVANVFLRIGVFGDAVYRRTFWKMAIPALKSGDIEGFIHISLISHHLITFARRAATGHTNASFYSSKVRDEAVSA